MRNWYRRDTTPLRAALASAHSKTAIANGALALTLAKSAGVVRPSRLRQWAASLRDAAGKIERVAVALETKSEVKEDEVI